MEDKTDVNTPLRELRGWRLVGFGLGMFGVVLPFSLVNGFSFQFYVYTIGLDALIVSIGQFLGSVFFGIFCVVFGVIADSKKPTRLGKRRMVFLWGIVPYCVIGVLFWIPPWKSPEGISIFLPTAIYFCSLFILYRIINAMLQAPLNAILPDISQTESNRIKVTGISVMSTTVSALIGMFLPVLIQSLVEDPLHTKWWEPSGEKILQLIPWMGTILAVIAILILLFTFFSIDEKFHYDNWVKAPAKERKQNSGLKETFDQIFAPMQDSEFKKLITALGLAEMGLVIQSISFIPFLTYVMKLKEAQFLWGYAAGTVVLVIGVIVWQKILKKIGLNKGLQLNFLANMCVSLLACLFFLPLPFWFGYGLGVFLLSVGYANSFAKYFFLAPMVGHLIDISPINAPNENNSDNSTKDISGAYAGLQLFVAHISIGLGQLILGFILSGARAENTTFILILYPILGVIFLLGWWILKKMTYAQPK